jgi:predicted unusual protein kinase regulating ubiquinone biosynthesis (AarF/ABC1/UbiB family)
MADLTSGRARRMLSVGGLTTSVGSSYLWQALKRPFQSASEKEQSLLETHVRNAAKIVSRSQELRGAFMKLVQMLSMRNDLLPPEALEVLATVQSQVPPMPWERVREVLAADLGQPPEALFEDFEPDAFAAASLGQVHRARLPGGRTVAVKVQYPGVDATVRQDIKNIRALITVMMGIGEALGQQVDKEEVIAELEARLAEELDYQNEARNMERFRALLADDPEVVVPRVFPERSGRRVLTMQYLRGYPLSELMLPGVDQAMKDWIALKLFRLMWRQVLDLGALHGDPQPGNYLVTHHPRLGLLDFGSVRFFEPAIRRGYLRMARGILAGDDAEMMAACRDLGYRGGDLEAVVRILHVVCEPLEHDVEYDARNYDLVERGWRIQQIAFEHKQLGAAPGHQVLLLRALAGLDANLKALGAVHNYRRLFAEVVEAAAVRHAQEDA